MSRPADQIDPTERHPGISLRDAASHVEGLLNEDGHVTDTDEPSRALKQVQDDDPSRQLEGADELEDELEEGTDEILADGETDDGDSEESETADTDELEAGSEGDAEEGDADTDETPVETLAQMAETLEIDIEDLKETLSHTFNAAGEEVTVTLAELESGYQKDADYRRSTAKLADDRRALEQDTENRMQLFTQSHTVTAAVLGFVHQMFTAELESPAMQELRARDPAEWAAKRQEILDRAGQLEQVRQKAAADYDNTLNSVRASVKESNLSQLNELENWGENARATVRETFESLGFTEDEVNGVMDARTVKGLLELSTLREENAALKDRIAKAEAAAKKPLRRKPVVPVKAGKGAQSGQPGGKQGVSKDRVSRLRRRLGQTHSVKDAANVIEATIL